MDVNSVIIIGAGGHAKVILSILTLLGRSVLGFVDDNAELQGADIYGYKVLGDCSFLKTVSGCSAICAFGDNQLRQKTIKACDLNWVTLIHPTAYVHESVTLGVGSVVFAGAIIQPDAVVGEHVIINTAASIDHDCHIGSFAHLAPGTHLGGGVKIGEGSFVGIGTNIKPYVSIGEWSILGVGSVVVKDIKNFSIAKGVPAKVYKTVSKLV